MLEENVAYIIAAVRAERLYLLNRFNVLTIERTIDGGRDLVHMLADGAEVLTCKGLRGREHVCWRRNREISHTYIYMRECGWWRLLTLSKGTPGPLMWPFPSALSCNGLAMG